MILGIGNFFTLTLTIIQNTKPLFSNDKSIQPLFNQISANGKTKGLENRWLNKDNNGETKGDLMAKQRE